MYKFGTLVLVPFPFTDLTSAKLRPALIVSKTNQQSEDIMVVFITTKARKKLQSGHFLLKNIDPCFEQTGLKVSSLFRFDKIATINKKLILGELGTVHKTTLSKMRSHFFSVFGFEHA
ncbi:type II toxin-antitoxin system PemK/MazF family toxin [Candidatus Peregrinibacteria bacterium]|nr:type II toxin-antitoxin system PemK/MazF family toxin [Candidatus Peregrinibacteria bacterium]